jgi:hypothetical protein
MCAETDACFRVKYLLFFSDFDPNWNVLRYFRNILQYQIYCLKYINLFYVNSYMCLWAYIDLVCYKYYLTNLYTKMKHIFFVECIFPCKSYDFLDS